MAISNKVDSTFNFEEHMKSRGVTHVKSYRSGNDIGKNITTGLVQTHVNVCHCSILYETKICYLASSVGSLNLK